jgi:hypothetical protein
MRAPAPRGSRQSWRSFRSARRLPRWLHGVGYPQQLLKCPPLAWIQYVPDRLLGLANLRASSTHESLFRGGETTVKRIALRCHLRPEDLTVETSI